MAASWHRGEKAKRSEIIVRIMAAAAAAARKAGAALAQHRCLSFFSGSGVSMAAIGAHNVVGNGAPRGKHGARGKRKSA